MSARKHLLSIDQGTTSTRAIVFTPQGAIVTSAQREITQHYPHDGWVEHDPNEIWDKTLAVCHQVIDQVGAATIAAIGITNQRETTLVWDRETGQPVYNAIVWQDRRTAADCLQFKKAGHETEVTRVTGLLLDPYFSATKLRWILKNVSGTDQRARAGELAFGTVDSWLLWRLTGGKSHATDTTNAARTLLFDLEKIRWSKPLLELFEIPPALLPEVKDCVADFGFTTPELFGQKLPITGIAGDQQAATIGQACFEPGMVKSTYGTGCFALLNTGDQRIHSQNRLLSTVAYRINGHTTYALEGSIFVAGAAIQWLRDEMHLIQSAAETEELAAKATQGSGVYFVPAFTGLGSPHWDPHARGAIVGLTRDSGRAEIVRAALEAVCYQTNDLLTALKADSHQPISTLRVDGGMVANKWLLTFMADILAITVERPKVIETTALGAAYLAGLGAGLYDSIHTISHLWQQESIVYPTMSYTQRSPLLQGWKDAIQKVRAHHQ